MELNNIRDELAFLTGIDAPSGFEEPILRYGRERFEKLVDEVTVDVRGNLYAKMHGIKADAPVVMVMALTRHPIPPMSMLLTIPVLQLI